MDTNPQSALAVAIARAKKTYDRQLQAAKNSVGGDKRRQQLQATADQGKAHWEGLSAMHAAHASVTSLALELLRDHQMEPHHRPSCALCQRGAEMFGEMPAPTQPHPFAGPSYRTDTGLHHTAIFDAQERLERVPSLTAEQCAAALRLPNLQVVVRKALERRLRALGKAGAA